MGINGYTITHFVTPKNPPLLGNLSEPIIPPGYATLSNPLFLLREGQGEGEESHYLIPLSHSNEMER
jgi:myosin-crossreactive antigen